MKNRLWLKASFFICIFLISCSNNEDQRENNDPTVFKTPVTKTFEFTEPQPIKWEVTDPDSMDTPTTYPLDIDKMPKQPFSISEFESIASPIEEVPWDIDSKKRIPLQFDTIPITVKTSILPSPIVTKMERPQVMEGTSSGLLQLSTTEGLPSNEIRKIIQNEDGTYWIATFQGGLCLYNGNDLYTYDYSDIWDIVLDHDGKLWIATADNGIYVLDFEKNTESHFLSNTTILRLHCDHQNKIWIIHWLTGTYVMDSDMKQLKKISNPGFEGGFPLIEDRDHNIWLSDVAGGQNVISVIGEDREDYIDILASGNSHFFLDQDNRMWMSNGTDTVAISLENRTGTILDEKNRSFVSGILYEQDNSGRLWIIKNDTIRVLSKDLTKLKTILTNSPVTLRLKRGCSMTDESGVIWIGTLTKGIILVDPNGALHEHLDVSNGLIDPTIWAMEEDTRGNIWLGTPAGINIYDPVNKEIIALNHDVLKTGTYNGRRVMQYLEEYEKDKFFIDGVGGFTIIDRTKNELTRHSANQWVAKRSFGLVVDEQNNFWIPTQRGLAVYNLETTQMKFLRALTDQFQVGPSRDIIDDKQGHYWVATTGGLAIINPAANSIKYLKEQEGLCSDNIMNIHLSENGRLWVATRNGVSVIDIKNQKITNLGEEEGLIPDEIYDLVEKDGQIYLGSVNGLVRVKRPTAKNPKWEFYNLASAQGFQAVDYHRGAALVRSNGQMWFGASMPPKLTIVTQDPSSDTSACPLQITSIKIMDEQVSFNQMADFKSALEPRDTLWYDDGRQFYLKQTLPLDSGYVFENNIQWDKLESHHNIPIGLKLPYHQNYVRFSYSNLCVLDRDKISYRYMLQGKENKWTYSGSEAESKNYYNLKPGGYTFKVSTKRGLNQWSPPAELSFQIIPPWWRTWWAYIGYVLITIGGIWLIVQYRSKQLKDQNRLLEEKVTERTEELKNTIVNLKSTQAQLIQSEKMASLGELTAGIAHEIQNPLNFVNNFSEINKELLLELRAEIKSGNIDEINAITDDLIGNEEKINHHGKRADAIVKGMLQHSRTSSAEKEPTDINKLADEYLRLAYHGLRAKDKTFNANLETDFDDSVGKINIIPQDIGRVLLNLISNAFYACNAKSSYAKASDDAKKTTDDDSSAIASAKADKYKPTVSIATLAEDEKVKITVKDNGNGIPKEVIDKIFQPFFTTKPTGEGTGLGLSMSYDIVTKGHGGELKVETKPGEGTIFTITLPK